MKKHLFFHLFLSFFLGLFSHMVFAWDHSIEFGYGYSRDPNAIQYHNSGFLLSGDLYALRRTTTTFWSITGALGQWHTTGPGNQNITTAAVSLALRLYPFIIAQQYPTYGFASFGPAFLSNQKYGVNKQASHLSIQTNLGLGAEFNPFDVNLRLVHYSNAGLAKPNDGFNVLFLLSLGYLF